MDIRFINESRFTKRADTTAAAFPNNSDVSQGALTQTIRLSLHSDSILHIH